MTGRMTEWTSRFGVPILVFIVWLLAMFSRLQSIPSVDTVEQQHQHQSVTLQNDTRKICLIYDKPPHTASSTTAFALESCWVKQLRASTVITRSSQGALYDPHVILSAVKIDAPIVAVYRRHLSISDDDIHLLKASCRRLFYVTSSRDMKGRLISYVKMRLSGNKTSHNGTVPVKRLMKYRSWVKRGVKKEEHKLELYPFEGNLALLPNYVVRYDHISEDLSNLLHNFGCEPNFTSTNIHDFATKKRPPLSPTHQDGPASSGLTANEKILNFFDNLPVQFGDKTYKRLTRRAEETNQLGLRRASEIRSLLERMSHETTE